MAGGNWVRDAKISSQKWPPRGHFDIYGAGSKLKHGRTEVVQNEVSKSTRNVTRGTSKGPKTVQSCEIAILRGQIHIATTFNNLTSTLSICSGRSWTFAKIQEIQCFTNNIQVSWYRKSPAELPATGVLTCILPAKLPAISIPKHLLGPKKNRKTSHLAMPVTPPRPVVLQLPLADPGGDLRWWFVWRHLLFGGGEIWVGKFGWWIFLGEAFDKNSLYVWGFDLSYPHNASRQGPSSKPNIAGLKITLFQQL